MEKITQSCFPYCSHTMQQHFAFDCGVQAGRDGSNAAEKIFDQPTSVLRDAWIEGYHTGKLMRVEA
jgi:hypothetical protein